MNSSIVVQTSGITGTQGSVWNALSVPNAQDSASVLVSLEEKDGNKNLRIDSGHDSQPRAHLRAETFRSYTEWLSSHVNSPSSEIARVSKTNLTQLASPQVIATSRPDNTAHADPSILATTDPSLLASKTQTTVVMSANLKEIRSAGDTVDMSIPVDNSGLDLGRLTRIDEAHSTQSLIKPKVRRNRRAGTQKTIVVKPSRIERPQAHSVLPTTPHVAPPATIKVVTPKFAKSHQVPSAHVPVSVVSWEVADFTWPAIVDNLGRAETQAAGILADAAVQVLGSSEQRLAVVGSGRGPGTTTIAMYLSKILAARQKSVLLIDADLSKPDLTSRLGIPTELNWLDTVKGNSKACSSVIRSVSTGICVMPVQKMATRVAWPRFVYDCLSEIVNEVRSNFDFVLIDIGPTSQFVRELSRPNLLVDAAMLVHNVRVPDHSTFVRNQNELSSFGIKRLVVAENFSTGAV